MAVPGATSAVVRGAAGTGSGAGGDSAAVPVELLRGLARGLATSRLYEGRDVPAVQQTTSTVQAAASRAVAAGPVVARFEVAGVVGAAGDALLDRLAAACVERGVTRLELRAVPTAEELARLYLVLNAPVDELLAAGGAAVQLPADRRSAIVVDGPAGGAGDDPVARLASVQASSLPADERFELAWAQLAGVSDGRALLAVVRELATELPVELAAVGGLERRVARRVAGLDPRERAAFEAAVLDAMGGDPLADRYLGQLNDLDLADLVLRVADLRGDDALALALQVVDRTGRHPSLTELVRRRRGELAGRGTADEAPVPAVQAERDLVAGVPDGPLAGRRLALRALVDVLAGCPSPAQVTAIGAAVTEQVRGHVVTDDPDGVRLLLTGWRRGLDQLPPSRTVGLDPDLVAALDDRVLRLLLRRETASASAVLHGFGGAAVAPLVELLGDDVDALVRAAAIALLRTLLPQHLDALAAAVEGAPPGVARRVLALLPPGQELRVGEVLRALARGADAQVALALLDVLPSHPDRLRLPVLTQLVGRVEDDTVRLRCIDELARIGPLAAELLERLADPRTSPLPRALRRHARHRRSQVR